MTGLLERFPIGSRWLDSWGDEQVVVGLSKHGGLRTVELIDETEEHVHHWSPSTGDDWTPYVEPEPVPEFKHFGYVAAASRRDHVSSGYHSSDTDDGDRWFEYGIEGGELFIRWCEGGA